MFKIIKKKKWDELIEVTKMEIDALQAKIEVSERYIKEYDDSMNRRNDDVYLQHRREISSQLPFLYESLVNRERTLKWLEEEV